MVVYSYTSFANIRSLIHNEIYKYSNTYQYQSVLNQCKVVITSQEQSCKEIEEVYLISKLNHTSKQNDECFQFYKPVTCCFYGLINRPVVKHRFVKHGCTHSITRNS